MSVTLDSVIAFVRFQYPTEDAHQHIANQLNIEDKRSLSDVEALEYYIGHIASDNTFVQLFETLQSSSSSSSSPTSSSITSPLLASTGNERTVSSEDPYADVESVNGSDEEQPPPKQLQTGARITMQRSRPKARTVQLQTGSWFRPPPPTPEELQQQRKEKSQQFVSGIHRLLR